MGIKFVKIFSGSESSLKAMESGKITSWTVLDTIASLDLLAKTCRRVTLVWIKAHVGHEGNERADELAKQATTKKKLTTIAPPHSYIKALIKDKLYQEWTKRWESEPTCRQTKQFFPRPDSKRSKELLKLARSQLSTIVQATTGHNSLAYPASLEDATINPLCGLCGEERETFHHFITNCPRLRETRIHTGNIDFDQATWTQESVLEFARIPAIDALLNR